MAHHSLRVGGELIRKPARSILTHRTPGALVHLQLGTPLALHIVPSQAGCVNKRSHHDPSLILLPTCEMLALYLPSCAAALPRALIPPG